MKIKEGDIVTVDIRVTHVEPYGPNQQIMGKMLPNGSNVGWLIPQEALVTLKKPTYKVGDEVWIDTAKSASGIIQHLHREQAWVEPHSGGAMMSLRQSTLGGRLE